MTVTRRDFLRAGGGAVLGGLVGRPAAGEPAAGPRSRVVLVREPKALGGGAVDGERLARMLDDAVCALLDLPTPEAAWRRLLRPDDVVGVKTNVWRRLRTPPELEAALVRRATGAGVGAGDVGVDDRGVLQHPVFRRATALVNIRPGRIHHWSGMGTCLKNYIMFVPRPADYHGNACESLGSIWRLPELDGKTRLNVLVMLTPLFAGSGPHAFSSEYTWPYAGLLVGTDPVAVDATGARILEARRAEFFGEPRPISPPLHHIRAAETTYGLGTADPGRIDLVRLGAAEGALI